MKTMFVGTLIAVNKGSGFLKHTVAVILCSSSLVVPPCMQAVEGAIVRSSRARRHGGAVEQDEMMATKSGPSDKSSLSKCSPTNL